MHLSIISAIKTEKSSWLLLGVVTLATLIVVQFELSHVLSIRAQQIQSATRALQAADPVAAEQRSRRHDALNSRLHSLTMPVNDLPGVLQLLIGNAAQADIEFVKMEPQAEPNADRVSGAQDYPVFLQFRTTYHNLGKFIAACEAMPQNMRIARLALTVADQKIDVKIMVTCFYQQSHQEKP